MLALNVFGVEGSNSTPISGFEWRQLPYIKSYVSKPLLWHFYHVSKVDEKRYFFCFSRENVQAGIKAQTALIIIAIQDVPQKTNVSPSQYAAETVANYKKNVTVLKEWKDGKGKFKEFGYIRVNSDARGIEHKEYFVAMANDGTGTVYFLSFTSPAVNWDAEWKKNGEIMIKNFYPDETL
jgi:hypothetical protein